MEQGPVLEANDIPVGAVLGTVGMRRYRVTFTGRAAHAGTTPMNRRNDPVLAAANTAIAVRDAAIEHDGVGTVGSIVTVPGIVTAVSEQATILVDQRHLDADSLKAMHERVRSASEVAAASEDCTVSWEPLLTVEPRPFDEKLVDLVQNTCRDACGQDMSLPSGALHDATAMASRVPTAMLFVSSTDGISHNRDEGSPEEHLQIGVEVFNQIVRRTMKIVADGQL
ncbi:M20/M25/M40 family metallo-hydrolase [Haloechinothrix salitolerans]|uniref:M20/M25/M40 family metallo-hydrolase n=1 Tax=Haloechinothrix salitolerans TaxID=926830 RepID=A0ABW2C3P9_9PSEU